MGIRMSIRMGTGISMSLGMSINHWNRNKLLRFTSYSANYSRENSL